MLYVLTLLDSHECIGSHNSISTDKPILSFVYHAIFVVVMLWSRLVCVWMLSLELKWAAANSPGENINKLTTSLTNCFHVHTFQLSFRDQFRSMCLWEQQQLSAAHGRVTSFSGSLMALMQNTIHSMGHNM